MEALARNIRRGGQVVGAGWALERIYRDWHLDEVFAGKTFKCLARSGTFNNEVVRAM